MALNLNSSLNINSGSINITQTPRTSVIYDSGLTFSASVSDVSTIASGLFSITSSIVTLDSADTTFDRIDAIVAEFSGSLGQIITNISGTASADPQFPLLDYDSQIPLKYIRVNANATTPSSAGTNPQDQTIGTDFENVLLYNENLGVAGGEWDVNGSTSYSNWNTIPGNNLASTEQAYSGSVSIKNSMARVLSYTDIANRLAFFYKRSEGNTIISSRLAGFSFYIKLTTDLSTSEPFLCAQFNENSPQNRDNQKTNGSYFTFPTFEDLGINTRNTTDWQYVTLPVTDFSTNVNGQANENWVITSFQMGTGVRARNIPSNSFVYIDYVQMHLGSLPTTDPNNDGTGGNGTSDNGTGVYKQGDTSFSIIPTNALSCVTNDFSTIGGGQNNTITASQYSYIGAGQNNILASGSNYSSILGGSYNTSSYENSFIIGSNLTSNKACYTFMNNLDVEGTVSASIFSGSFVGDGSGLTNVPGGGGGSSITVQDNGTSCTTALSLLNFVGATVTEPTADNVTVTIGSGLYELGGTSTSLQPTFNDNCVCSADSTIAGGFQNTISGSGTLNSGSYIGSGYQNQITSSAFSRNFIGTGFQNQIKNGQNNFIGAGVNNIINASVGVIFGANNIIQGADGDYAASFSTILGGDCNIIQSDYGGARVSDTIINGSESLIDADGYNLIGNGRFHQITGSVSGSAILAGEYNQIKHSNSFILGSNITSSAEDTTYVNNLDVEGTVSASIFSGSFVGDGSGLTNVPGGGGGNSITVQDNGTPLTTDLSLLNFVGATVTEPTADNVTVTIGSGLYEAGTGACSINPTIGSNTVAAPTSSIAGGELNNISCVDANSSHNFIGGGRNNLISGSFAGVIVGGGFNTLTTGSSNTIQIYDFIGGGNQNIAGGGFSSVVGGQDNEATGCVSGVFGGSSNKALSRRSTVMGGQCNIVSGSDNSAILGGNDNCVSTTYTGDGMGEFILGGKSNVILGDACCSTIIGGRDNTITHRNSHIIGGTSFTSQAERTTYVENLHVTSSIDQANSITSILTLNRRETTPDSPLEGMIMASGSAGSSKLYYYNGSSWNSLF